jgi:peroxiredoxin
MTAPRDLMQLPSDLPIPEDDGACDHLTGMALPAIALPSTAGGSVNLAESAARRSVVYVYPRTGRPDRPGPPGWDDIPGARGCTPQSCAFRDHHAELVRLGVAVYGLSTQTTDYQQEMVARLHLPFPVLSDSALSFAQALELPRFEWDGETLIKRLTLVVRDGRIEHVFYPVFPPDANAETVIAWLTAHPE